MTPQCNLSLLLSAQQVKVYQDEIARLNEVYPAEIRRISTVYQEQINRQGEVLAELANCNVASKNERRVLTDAFKVGEEPGGCCQSFAACSGTG